MTIRAEFQTLADMRIREAKILLDAGEFAGAYYLAGYALECALKSCIIRMLNTSDVWQDRKFSEMCWQHNLAKLMSLAGLETDIANSGPVTVNWGVAARWNENSRYEVPRPEVEARDLYTAITHPTEGVLQWLKARW